MDRTGACSGSQETCWIVRSHDGHGRNGATVVSKFTADEFFLMHQYAVSWNSSLGLLLSPPAAAAELPTSPLERIESFKGKDGSSFVLLHCQGEAGNSKP
jgi:hypothetical protein